MTFPGAQCLGQLCLIFNNDLNEENECTVSHFENHIKLGRIVDLIEGR